MNFMQIYYNDFKIGNVKNKWTLSELRPVLLTKWSTCTLFTCAFSIFIY
jgi:hypothetical protein